MIVTLALEILDLNRWTLKESALEKYYMSKKNSKDIQTKYHYVSMYSLKISEERTKKCHLQSSCSRKKCLQTASFVQETFDV